MLQGYSIKNMNDFSGDFEFKMIDYENGDFIYNDTKFSIINSSNYQERYFSKE